MNRKYSLVFLIALCAIQISFSQININATGVDYTINFSTTIPNVNTGVFTGNGFLNNPSNGFLDANAWATSGFSDGNKDFGVENNAGDHARGISTSTTGGIYGVDIGSGNQALVIRPTAEDFTPGTLSLALRNTTGTTLSSVQISYTIVVRNDQNRSVSINFAHSGNHISYQNEPSLNYISPDASDLDGYKIISRSIVLSSLSISDGSLYYLQWQCDDVAGSGSRDLIGIDDITINAIDTGPVPEIQLTDASLNNQNCGFSLDFGNVASDGSFSEETIGIQNLGSVDLIISNITSNTDFALLSPTSFPINIPAGSSELVTVRFNPSANGARTGALTITSNDLDEGICTINLSGVGFTPAPEIDVERNTFASIPSGATANTGNNTVFAASTIGNSTAPKIYYIRNEGSADLNITSISSSNNSEFSVINNPAPTVLSPNQQVSFEVVFSPSATGIRNSSISIFNNDPDENTYVFALRGTGVCAASSFAMSPSTGPVGTIVTVTGSNFGPGTTASIGTMSTSVVLKSSTEMEIAIPQDATTGSLNITDVLGCSSSRLFTVIDQRVSDCEGISNAPPSDVFISEITDKGSGSHSYIELYNGTGTPINLTAGGYQLRIHNNGSSIATGIINLSGILPNNSTVVAAMGGTNATDPEGGFTAQFFSSILGINEDDHIRLYKGGNWIDLWGDTSGNAFTIASKDYTYRRKNSGITVPSVTWSANDWHAQNPVNYSDIGTYDFSLGIPPIIDLHPVATANSCDLNTSLVVTALEGFTGSNSLVYQWFYNAPGQSDWTAISTSGNFTGGDTVMLELSTDDLNGYQFYAQVRESSADCFQASNAVKLIVKNTTWNGSSWSSGFPDLSTSVIIDGSFNTGAGGLQNSFSACNLRVNDGSEMTVDNTTFLEIQNDISVNGKLVIAPSGSVIQIDDGGQVDGAVLTDKSHIVVEKETATINAWYEYTYWSSPVIGELVGNALSLSPPDRRFTFNAGNFQDSTMETNNNNATVPGQDGIDDDGNVWQIADADDVMMPGVGYAATLSKVTFAGSQQYKHTFEGAFNNGTILAAVERNDAETADENQNFIGNPYPSAIDVDLFFDENRHSVSNPSGTLEGVVYLWSHHTPPSRTTNGNEPINFSQSDYAVINGSGQVAGGDMLTPNRRIPSGQAFFVLFSDNHAGAIGNVRFTNPMRVRGDGDNSQFFRSSPSAKKRPTSERLWINLSSDNGVFNQICLAYLDGATEGYDGIYYDAERTITSRTSSVLYSKVKDRDDLRLSIQGRNHASLNTEESVELGFYSSIEVPTQFQLSLEGVTGTIIEEFPVVLKDKLLGTVHDLSKESYKFRSERGEFKDRFEIVFNSETLSEEIGNVMDSKLEIFELHDGHIRFSISQYKISTIEIYDLLGRKIIEHRGHSENEIVDLSSMSLTAYIAKIWLDDGQLIVKRAIKKL